jgi:hypothetical protein
VQAALHVPALFVSVMHLQFFNIMIFIHDHIADFFFLQGSSGVREEFIRFCQQHIMMPRTTGPSMTLISASSATLISAVALGRRWD